MMETMEQYKSKTRENDGPGVVRPKINDKTHFELKRQYLKELRENTFNGSEHEDANEHIEKVLEIVDLFPRFKELLMKCPQHYLTDMQEVILFYNGLDVPTRQILDSKGVIPTKTAADVKIVIQEMAEYSHKWHNGTSSKASSTKTSDGLTAIQAQLNNLRREIKKVNKKVYAAQVRCELCKGPHYTKDCPLKEEGNTLEEAYYTQFGTPYQPAGQYRAAGPGFYQHNNGNSSYPDRRHTLEESLTKFMAESAKKHEENSNIIKEIRASTDAAIRNQEASIKTLEIQIGQMSKVLQERGIRGLPGSTEPNPRDHVKSISTAKVDSFEIRCMRCSPYAVSGSQHKSMFSEIVPFPRRLQNYYCDDWREAQDVKILEAYDNTLPQKKKNPWSFTLPCFIHNVCFDKALVDLGASVSVMPFFTYTNLGLGILSHTRLTIELADRTIKQPRGIAENVLVRIGKFIFPIDFIILDIPEDDDVPLILGRPFLSTAHSKIDVYKRKITLRVGEEKLVFKREDNESFDPIYGNYIELNDLDTPLEPETNPDVDFEPTVVNEPDNVKTTSKCCYKMKFSCTIGYKNINVDFILSLSDNLITKSVYYSIIKDKDDHEGKSPAGTLKDIPVFVGKFSILTGFIIIDDKDVTRDVVLGMPFFIKYVSCYMVMKKFAHGDKCERIMKE
ncbi:retrovirus-related pol polyprotein from transposon TNT 1-94 [Tanacetum coccineum]|uniref:Retrovirus-related pol polyprotein from transposon TNT 1-94 n=1 Tax=Tanacetum coccineum TaxID=301880 RepID=A0ABQ5EGK1_9ASTR